MPAEPAMYLPPAPPALAFAMHPPPGKPAASASAPALPAPPAASAAGAMEAGSAAHAGARAYQHDRVVCSAGGGGAFALAAALDGHGEAATGHLVSAHCARALPAKLRALRAWRAAAAGDAGALRAALAAAVAELEREALALNASARAYAGSTLCVALAAPAVLAVANVGDSRAVLGAVGAGGGGVVARALSRDHVPDRPDERARIAGAGGWVRDGSLNGYISMSRALGDADLKVHRNRTRFEGAPPGRVYSDRLFTAEPEIVVVPRDPAQRFVVVATDGVWGSVSSASAVRIVDAALRAGASAEKAAGTLVRRAIAAGSGDNLAAAVLVLDRAGAPEYCSRWGRLGRRRTSLGIRNRLRRRKSDEDLTVHGAHKFLEEE